MEQHICGFLSATKRQKKKTTRGLSSFVVYIIFIIDSFIFFDNIVNR